MKMTNGMADLMGAELQKLRRVMRRLKEEQTDGRRRSARRKVKTALVRLATAMDLQYPAPARVVPTGPRKRAAWPPAGHAPVPAIEQSKLMTQAAMYGIKAKPRPTKLQQTTAQLKAAAGANFSLPAWFIAAQALKATVTSINAAKKDLQQRKAFLAAHALSNPPTLSI